MSDLFKNILIATDGSKYTDAAIRESVALAAFHKAKLYALYVIDTRALATVDGMPEPGNMYLYLEAEGKQAIAKVKQLAGSTPVETFVLAGHPSSTITSFAKDNGIDLIVTGSLGKSGIEELLLGSVADKIIRTAPCPVLVVKAQSR